MEFSEVVRRRRMVRSFTDEPVPTQALDRMLEHAVRAPSAGFSQGWAFLRLDAPLDVERFWRSTSPDPDADNAWLRGMRTAPAIVVPLAHRDSYVERYAEPDKGWTDRDEARWLAPYWFVDTGMASLLILQTAVDEGPGACFFGVPTTRVGAFRAAFGIPEQYAPVGAIAVGHPDGAAARGSVTRRTRRPLAEVVHRGHWRG